MTSIAAPAVAEPAARESLARRPVRVLCVDYSIGFGGATKSMALMLRGVPDVDPIVLTSQDPDLRQLWYGEWPVLTFRRRINYRTQWLLSAWMEKVGAPRLVRVFGAKAVAALSLLTRYVSVARIAWLCLRHRIDVVHLANGFTPAEALLGARIARVPSIAHLRGFYSGGRSPRRRFFGAPALVIGDSGAVTASYVDHSGLDVPATTIYEVVDVAQFDGIEAQRAEVRAAWQLADSDVAVAIFGRVIDWKGQLEFVRAMLSAMELNPTLVGMIVGDSSDGTADYFAEVKRVIRESGRADRFRLTGYIEQVEPLYSAADIVVHASLEPEPCGMVIQEAMAAGRAVITADAGGPRELVREGVDGRRTPPGDVPALSEAILELAADPATRARMGQAGRERARDLYDVPAAAARLRRIYEHLAASTAGTAPAPLPGWVTPP